MSRQFLIAGALSKVALCVSLALSHADMFAVSSSLIVGGCTLLPAAYEIVSKLLDRMMRLPDAFEPATVMSLK